MLAELIGRRTEVDRAREAFLGRFYREWLDAAHATTRRGRSAGSG